MDAPRPPPELAQELTAWVRAARPNQSYGALPPGLQAFVASRGLTALRALMPADVQDRVACIKRREQNQRALEARKAVRSNEVNALQVAVDAYRGYSELMAAHADAMDEYEEYLSTQDGDDIFGPAAQAGQLFKFVHAGRRVRGRRGDGPFGVGGSGTGKDAGEAGGEGGLFKGPLSVAALGEVPGGGHVAGGAASDEP